MSGATGAIIGGAVIGAAGSAYSANQAAGASSSASRNARETELYMFNQGRTDLAPYREAGYDALDQIRQLYGLGAQAPAPTGPTPIRLGAGNMDRFGEYNGKPRQNPTGSPVSAAAGPAGARDLSAFYASPNYQFIRDQGLEGITNSRSAQGGQLSGNALRGAQEFSSNLASGEFNNYVNRLFGIAGLGSGAVNTGVQAGTQTGNSIANIYQNAGNARASAYTAGAAGVNNSIQGGLQNWAFQNYLTGNTNPAFHGVT